VPQLATSHAALTAFQEEKIRQLAYVLHDELGQNLAILKLRLGDLLCSDPVSRDEILNLVDDTLNKVRRVALDLGPPGFTEFGLISSLEYYISDFSKNSGIRCEFKVDSKDLELGSPLDLTVFRIVQESLTNILKHSGATYARVSIEHTTSNLILEIQDNGRGIAANQIHSSTTLGLASMRARVIQLRGQFHISGEPGQGTKVMVIFPFKKPCFSNESLI
jgi:two-component system, NarL family, sensor histidine kinase UhpB